ncbi:hypothetical protein PMAYCL1PPCAC_04723 [Pristionchus mayeri]|uniref:Carboxypeptidase Q n=1 Tax=Pristionchus mayeri TaxID=1317129 RepID=A0AAN4Z9Q4_9BILA|nr:hypothetical protein PMAYCL1PPCAC_04723 [Pristionchus mayeri]
MSAILLSLLVLRVGSISEFSWQTSRLISHLTNGPETREPLRFLEELCDDYGPRQVGSKNLEKAIDFVVKTLRNDGFDNVHTEKVDDLPYWIRGEDKVEMIYPRHHKFNVLAVDGSPSGFVEAEVVVVRSYGDLTRISYSGKIVVIAEPYYNYGRSWQLRSAARVLGDRGAAAVLLASAAPLSLYTTHTGSGARGSRIPSLSITTEEAEMLARMYERKKRIVLRLDVRSREMPYKTSSRNVVFEIKGSKKPKEVVLISAHIDSWDVGQGAVDDGGGIASIRSAMRAIRELSIEDSRFRPERTIRGVFFTAEEQGYMGARAYDDAHKDDNIIFAAETDMGAFRPRLRNSTFRFMGDSRQQRKIEAIAAQLTANQIPMRVNYSDAQGDVYNLAQPRNIPAVNFVPDKGDDNFYFRYHHTAADYVSVFEEGDLEYTAAVFASLANVIANQDRW